LLKGTITQDGQGDFGEPSDRSMDSEELEALQEEQKLVDSMIKKGTM